MKKLIIASALLISTVLKTIKIKKLTISTALLISVALLVFVGCNYQLEQQWVGKNVEDLTAELGTPNKIQFDGLAAKVYVYIETANVTTSKTSGQTEPNEPVKIQGKAKAIMFWIDRKGIISKVKQQAISISTDK